METGVQEFDQFIFTLKSGNIISCFMEKKNSRKIAGQIMDRLLALKKPMPNETNENDLPNFMRIDGWKATPIVLSIIHTINLEEVAAFSVLDHPQNIFKVSEEEAKELLSQ